MDSHVLVTVIELVSLQTGIPVEKIHAETTLQELGVDGDDAVELLQMYAQRFDVDLQGFQFERYFGPEVGATPFSLLAAFLGMQNRLTLLSVGALVRGVEQGELL